MRSLHWLGMLSVVLLVSLNCGDDDSPTGPGNEDKTVTLSSPASNAIVAGDFDVEALLDTSVVRGDNLKSTELIVDGTTAVIDTLPFPAVWGGELVFTLDTDQLAEGSHTLLVRATDLAGNVFDSSTRTFSIQNDLTYTDDILPILTTGCAVSGCHNSSSMEQGLDLSSYQTMMEGGDHGSVVIPGSAKYSPLIQRVSLSDTSSSRMPFNQDPLDDAIISRLTKWIDDGAKKDDGSGFFDGVEDRILNTNQGTDVITVIERSSGLVMRVVPVGHHHHHLEVPHFVITDDSPNPEYFYTTLIRADELWQFSLEDYTFVAKTNVGTLPAHVIVTPDGATAFVSNWDTGGGTQTVQVVDTATMTVSQVLTVGKAPHGMRITNDETRLFIGNSVSDDITVVDMATITIDTTFALLKDEGETLTPLQIAIDPNDEYAYVACHEGGEVQVIDIDSLKVVKRIDVGRFEGDTPGCFQVETSRRGDYVVVANQLNSTITIISQSTQEVITIIDDDRLAQCHGVDISEDGSYAYVTNENTSEEIPPHHPSESDATHGFVAYINLDTNPPSLEKVVEVQNDPTGITITPGLGN